MKYCTLLFFLFFSSLAHSQQEIFFIQYAKVFDVEATHDHNYSVVGWSGNVNGGNYFFSKLDSLGNEIWRHDNTAFNGTNFNNAMYRIHENTCLLYTSDAADERSSVDLGGSRIITKKKKKKQGTTEKIKQRNNE